MVNSMLLDKLNFCCDVCGKLCKDCDFPVFVRFRNVNIEFNQKNYNACCNFSFCPWCCFKYYNLENVWKKDLLETYKINYDALEATQELPKIPNEFDGDEWWIKREYFDFTKGYGGEKSVPVSKTYNHAYCCDLMYDLLDKNGHDSFRSYIKFFPNICTYVILSKKRGYKFEPIDYCPFCGAKFPKRLGEELSKILQSEYGLESWKDYKKAPAEFHSDEWWKKRGL
jgi:hypothetical protein